MAEPSIELRDAIKAAVDSALSITLEKRYAPYLDPGQLATGKWLIVLATDETSEERRSLAENELAVDLAWQIAVPEIANRTDEFLDSDWCDAQVELLGTLKALFRPGGSLRDTRLADCDFRRYVNSPIYRPDLLLEHGIFTGVVRLVYSHELNDE